MVALGQTRRLRCRDDGIWRSWSSITSRHGTITYQAHGIDQPHQIVPVRALVEWAAARLTTDDWERLDRLDAETTGPGPPGSKVTDLCAATSVRPAAAA